MFADCHFDGTLVIHREVQGQTFHYETNIALPADERQKVFIVRQGPTEKSFRIQLTKYLEIVYYLEPRRRQRP